MRERFTDQAHGVLAGLTRKSAFLTIIASELSTSSLDRSSTRRPGWRGSSSVRVSSCGRYGGASESELEQVAPTLLANGPCPPGHEGP